jgi:hypothetical protein
MNHNVLTSILVSTALFVAGTAVAGPLDKVQFIKIAPQNAKAVIKTADGTLRVINPGDTIGEGVTVKEIAAGRIVLEEKTDQGSETVIVRMGKGAPRTERVGKLPDSKTGLVAPITSGD